MIYKQRKPLETVYSWFARGTTMSLGYKMEVTLAAWGDATCLVEFVFNAVMLVTGNAIPLATPRVSVSKRASIDVLMNTSAKRDVIIQTTVHRVAIKCRRQFLSVVTISQCHVILILESFLAV